MPLLPVAAQGFQFHKGTIRTPIGYHWLHSFSHFNSIKVRLEQTGAAAASAAARDFNSIKVRLELYYLINAGVITAISIP